MLPSTLAKMAGTTEGRPALKAAFHGTSMVARLVVEPRAQILSAEGRPIRLTDLTGGDALYTRGYPERARSTRFHVRLVRDINVVTRSLTGVVTGIDPSHHRILLRQGASVRSLTFTVPLGDAGSHASGRTRPPSALHTGARVRVAATYNTRLHRYLGVHGVSVIG
jgi:hypothetical protein